MAFLLSALPLSSVMADECETKADEIARTVGLDAGKRTPAGFIPLSARANDDYGAYLLCKGSLGLTLQYLSPPSPAQKWFEFVSHSGAVLTGIKPASIALGVKNCVENARLRKGPFHSPGSAFQMVCSVAKTDDRVELSLAGR
jgi:hypothetical protein